MVTRNIKANTATQVNANLIGVQVRPEVVPPTYEVEELTANIQIDKFLCDNMMNGLPMLYIGGSGNEIWAYTGTQEEYDGTVYNVWSCVMGSDPGYDMLTNVNDEIADQTQFYIYNTGEHLIMPGPYSDYVLKYDSGVLYHFDPNGYYYVFDGDFYNTYLNGNPECDLVDGFFMSKETGEFLGMYVSDEIYIEEDYACLYGGESGGYFIWHPDFSFLINLYSTKRNPAIGDNLISNDFGAEAYTSQVTSVTETEVDPGYEEDVDCTLSYSVDGSTWTEWPENMTDDNNVISNIPRYMYLKFSQDVVITEE